MAAKEHDTPLTLRPGTFPDFDRALPGAAGLDALGRIAQAHMADTLAEDLERVLEALKDLPARDEDDAASRQRQALQRHRDELAHPGPPLDGTN
jgi:hypothetical protein